MQVKLVINYRQQIFNVKFIKQPAHIIVPILPFQSILHLALYYFFWRDFQPHELDG